MCVYSIAMMCVGRFGLGWAHNAFIFTCHMFMHFHAYVPSSFYIFYIVSCWFFSDCLSLPLSLFLTLVALWYLNVNLFRLGTFFILGASFSSSPSDPILFHIQFHDEKAKSNFLENFSWRSIHLECQVVLSDFFDTDLPIVIHNKG